MPRPDQSFFLAHFTKNGPHYNPTVTVSSPTIDQMSALERLISILTSRQIKALRLSWTNRPAVCFTECPWGSLLRHANNYSPYGIGFTKKLIYSRGGNPVIYANPEMFRNQNWAARVYPFLTPFVPSYAADAVKNQPPFNGRSVDFTHEREWRIARDFAFQYSYITFVILESVKDLDRIPDILTDQIGIGKFIFMDTYKKIEDLWPNHVMD